MGLVRQFTPTSWSDGELTTMLRIICAVAAGLLACSQASAAEKTMPMPFIGEWCFSSQEGKTISYTLPSWTEGGLCKTILSIHQYGFYARGRNCEPAMIRQKSDCAPSGCALIARVVARCRSDGPVTAGKPKTLEFSRYKGNLSVTSK